MRKNVICCVDGMILIILGIYIYLTFKQADIGVAQWLMIIIACLVSSLGFFWIAVSLIVLWKCCAYVPDPINQMEWRRVCKINAIQDGRTKNSLVIDWLDQLNENCPIKGSIYNGNFNCLHRSIEENLAYSQREIIYGKDGELVYSPWIATKLSCSVDMVENDLLN